MSLRTSTLAGMIEAAVFALIVVVLTRYAFMVRLGWDPAGGSPHA